MAVDPNKPLRFTDRADCRKITLIGVMPNGNLVVISTTRPDGEFWEAPMVFDHQTGKPVLEPGVNRGSGLVIENKPVVRSGFWPLDRHGAPGQVRGLVSLAFAKSDHPGFSHYLEIVYTDDVPTEAKIHAR